MMIYDGKRISSTVDKLIDPTTYAPLSDEEVTEYEYDGMGRITAIDNVTYEYDTYGKDNVNTLSISSLAVATISVHTRQ